MAQLRERIKPMTQTEKLAFGSMAYEAIKDTPLGKVIDAETERFFEEMRVAFTNPTEPHGAA